MVTSGLRIGTPALATRGFDEAAFVEVSDIVATALLPEYDAEVETALQARVSALAAAYPLYPDLH